MQRPYGKASRAGIELRQWRRGAVPDPSIRQDLLEELLEGSKPAHGESAAGLDYLLATPFRYPPLHGGSRFRAATDPGVFYGAQQVRTACAELGYWRWRFLTDAVELERLGPVAHTAFRAAISTAAVDLRELPFEAGSAVWTHPGDYGPTQDLARAAREGEVGAIVYRSVRDPHPSWCVAVLTPAAFARRRPQLPVQNWWLSVDRGGVIWRRERALLEFAFRTSG